MITTTMPPWRQKQKQCNSWPAVTAEAPLTPPLLLLLLLLVELILVMQAAALLLPSSFFCSATPSTMMATRNVSYDQRAITIDGQRKLLISASIHYPRSTPQMWADLIGKAKLGGVDVIESYMFWNMHEPQQGKYVFDGRLDLLRFIKETQKAGLYFHLRIGPYACAEWNYGGFPMWLHFLPGIELRTDNAVFKAEMKRITSKIVGMLKDENLFYWQGGPVILTQIENEYGNIDAPYGPSGKRYMHWAADMALGLDTKVPWVMCQQQDAPLPIINTCNGFYCDHFEPNSRTKPKMWTENWTGWFLSFGGLQPYRPVEDIAFAVARFFQKGGTFQNYYMYHGGTNFERTAGGPFIATSYDYDAPIDEYGLLRQPKWGHLADLHKALRMCEKALLYGEATTMPLGPSREVTMYRSKEECCAFLSNKAEENYDGKNTVQFHGRSYELPPWSVSILYDCTRVIFNTATVHHQTTVMDMRATSVVQERKSVPLKDDLQLQLQQKKHSSQQLLVGWQSYKEPVIDCRSSPCSWEEEARRSDGMLFTQVGFKDQINTTRDTTDYLWYIKSLNISSHSNSTLKGLLSIRSLGHAMLLFLNGEFLGHAHGNYDLSNFQIQLPLYLKQGENQLALLSTTIGMKNYGSFFDTVGAGIDGPISITIEEPGGAGQMVDLSSGNWTYQIGLKGEELKLFSMGGNSSRMQSNTSIWESYAGMKSAPAYQPLIWYKTTFDSPPGSDPVAVDLKSMGKGQAWVNGKGIGRYWASLLSSNLGCYTHEEDGVCSYKGPYDSSKCNRNCGQPSQRWYHIPRSWLEPSGNTLVLLEEVGGDPYQISFAIRVPGTICGTTTSDLDTMTLECGPEQEISSIDFASYGKPQGSCQFFRKGQCHAPQSLQLVKEACLGKQKCSLDLESLRNQVSDDPCPGTPKSLAVQATCQ